MKITRQQLTDTDYETLFTRNPGTFIEAIIINIMWTKGTENEAELIAKQRYIFERWIDFYSKFVWDEALSVAPNGASQADAFRAGQIHALRNLPMRGVLHKSVDLREVARMLNNLGVDQIKAVEPKE